MPAGRWDRALSSLERCALCVPVRLCVPGSSVTLPLSPAAARIPRIALPPSPPLQPGVFRCACGAEERLSTCAEGRAWRCARPCGRPLACGRHTCESTCHSGACGACPLDGARACPCGKAEHPGLTCADKVPTCGETCGRLLACGVHRCIERCHYGTCPQTCKSLVVKSCRYARCALRGEEGRADACMLYKDKGRPAELRCVIL